MTPTASVLFPTRRRRDYLAVALASVAPQLARHRAQLVVVEDDPEDAETRRLVEGHGGRYLAHGAPRGINVARNTALEAATGELLCFLDDDVEAWPGWLDALARAAAKHPEHEAFGGPIRPRLEDGDLHWCGREPLPVTSLDLGPEDTDADFAWGANLALRRSALERIGGFDPSLGGAGDEEDWQRRLRAAGGRVRYVAAAGVDHRRAGTDARIPSLSRAAYHRGRAARRWDERKGTAPGLAAELRTLAGCLWHVVRRRCGNGIVLAAQTAGRIREAASRCGTPGRSGGPHRPEGPHRSTGPVGSEGPAPTAPPFLSGHSGTLSRRTAITGAARDAAADVVTLPGRVSLLRAARQAPPRRVLVLGVARPERARTVAAERRELARSRHELAVHLEPPLPGRGKWHNLNATLTAHPAAGFDWLLLLDDDVRLPHGFLDAFLVCAERFGFTLAQPAHAFASHAAWDVTRRRPRVFARRTRFVEIGPVTAIHRAAFPVLLPFPDLRMGWGLDAHWGALADEHGWTIGVVDATPVRHLRPVASAYGHAEAVAEATAFLDGRAYVTREQAGETLAVHRSL